METTSSRSSNKKDPGWKYNALKDSTKPNHVTCNFCNKTTIGGINRAKLHQMVSLGNATACLRVPEEVKEELWNYYNEKKSQKSTGSSDSFQMFNYAEDCEIGDDDLDEVELVEFNSSDKRLLTAKSGAGMQGKGKKTKGLMDLYFMKPESIVQRRKEGKIRQTSLKDSDPEARARTVQYIARFFYHAGIPFNAARLDSFKCMVEAIGRYGPNLKSPSYHELRVPLLKKELQVTNDMLEDHKKKWAKYGCSIKSDAWADRRQISIINFLVNCPAGTMFVESVDASSYMKTGDKLYELLDAFVERIGEENVIQVITESGSNYVLAGQLLQAKRKHLFWTPCAAYCVNLILEDIGKLPNVKRTLERAIFLVGFIYNHTSALSLMRTFTKKKELVSYGVTRFATTYLTLQRVHKQKINLRKMFTSDEWLKSKFYKEAKGKRATGVVLMPSFWNEVVYALKVMGPLVGVLRLAENEKKPAMGYIYEAMDRAKEAIQKAFDGNEDKYKHVFSIIDNRWENQLHHPLHAAGHFLNPQFFYSDPSIATNKEVVRGLYDCIQKLIPNPNDQDKIVDQLHLYKEAVGMFADPMAIRSRSKRAPAQWWSLFGVETPELMNLAIQILSLTCNAAGCERNWSIFEQIHSKKRNRLEHKKKQDLVFVRYNQALKARYNRKDEIDPISLDYIDDSNEWLIGKMGGDQDDAENEFVFGEDDLTWGEVATASGAEKPRKYTRRNYGTQSALKSSSSKGKAIVQEVEEEEADTKESEEQIEDYHSSDGNDSSDDDEMDAAEEDDIDVDDLF